jgi:hypothetical protein
MFLEKVLIFLELFGHFSKPFPATLIVAHHCCQIILGPNVPKREKYTKLP